MEILVPSGKIKKFVDLVSGFILLIAIINPVISILNKGIDLKEYQLISSNFLDKKSIEANSKVLEDKQIQQIIQNYRNRVIKQIENSAGEVKGVANVKADIILNEDYNSKDFGYINRVYISFLPQEADNTVKPVTNINKVKIKVGDEVKKGNEPVNEKFKELKNKVEIKISELLQVPKEKIVISIIES